MKASFTRPDQSFLHSRISYDQAESFAKEAAVRPAVVVFLGLINLLKVESFLVGDFEVSKSDESF